MERINKKDGYLQIAKSVCQRSTCLKRHYGAIIVNDKDEIIATGYNGSPRGEENCCDKGYCPRINKPHNTGDYSDCCAVHAEQNAMLSAARRDMENATLYLWGMEKDINGDWIDVKEATPCPICLRMIKNSGIKSVVNNKNVVNIH